MDLRKVKTLIDLVAESSITELEITEGDGKVRIVKAGSTPLASNAIAPAGSSPSPVPVTVPVAAVSSAVVAASVPAVETTGHVVKSPMVGTYYSAGAPGKPPFVEVGSKVSASDTVCIIEAMKLLNEIEAGFDGEIKKILVQNGQPVEYGQALFVIE
jgi:acetyl-CoA carboxylase biotin carboxyl carrier protein